MVKDSSTKIINDPEKIKRFLEIKQAELQDLARNYGGFDKIPGSELSERRFVSKNLGRGKGGISIVPLLDDPNYIDSVISGHRISEVEEMLKTPQIATEEAEQAMNRNKEMIVSRMDAYLQTEKQITLREYQKDVFEDIRDYFASGEHFGYVNLPTGAGKDYIAGEIMNALKSGGGTGGIKTVVLSDRQTLIDQISQAVEKATGSKVGTYSSLGKQNMDSDFIVTTYQSFINMFSKGEVDPACVGLVILDEAHKALGEKRHRIMRAVPNALGISLTATPHFEQIYGYESRGIVDSSERWVGLFKNCIHEMSLQEGIDRGVLSQLHAHVISTDVNVKDVKIVGGEYDSKQLARYLDTESRNYMALAMICGAGNLPQNVKMPAAQLNEINEINRMISGRRTVVFGLSISHIDELARRLNDAGVTARAVHSNLSMEDRREALKAYKKGSVKVLLTVDMLREGWDSPETEVGIMLQPTRSGIVATQRLGRILRQNDEGNKNAIAIEVVDNFRLISQTPVLLPNILDPYYIMRGTQYGRVPVQGKNGVAKDMPRITFGGMDLSAAFEATHIQKGLSAGFKQMSIPEINDTIEGVIKRIRKSNPDLDQLGFYRELVDNLPLRVNMDAQERVLRAIASIDTNESRMARSAALYINLKTVLAAVKPFMSSDNEENNEIISASVPEVLRTLGMLKLGTQILPQIYVAAYNGAARYVAAREGLPVGFVQKGGYGDLKREIEGLMDEAKLSGRLLDESAQRIAEKFDQSIYTVRNYMLAKLGSGRERGYLEDDAALSRVAFGGRKGAATKILENMSYRQRVFVEMKYGFRGEEHTLSDIADILPRINSWGSFWFGVSGVHRVAPWGVSVLPLHTSLSVCN